MISNLLLSLSGCAASLAGVFFAGMESQQGQPGSAHGGTPSQQPQPANPTPRPANPGQPGQNQPGQQPAPPGQNQPGQTQPGQTQPGQTTPIERQPGQTPLNRGDNPQYFPFADESMAPRFRQSATRLAGLERAMAERNQRLTERLGALRQLPPDRQNGAMLDLLQEILQENARLQEYLVQSRTLFTGDIEDGSNPSDNRSGADRPAARPTAVAPAPSGSR